jgi:uncharacterized protein (DUF2126 family)
LTPCQDTPFILEETDKHSFDQAIRAHDEAVAARGLDIWIGAEPTFTNRRSESSEWLNEALGETKLGYARRIIERLHASCPGALILRTVGRQYPDEPTPRWSLGLYQRRDGSALADTLPRDPVNTICACSEECMLAFWQALTCALNRDGWTAVGFRIDDEMGLRILFRCDALQAVADPEAEPRLARAPLQSHPLPPEGGRDDLAAEGLFLVALGLAPTGPENSVQPCLELPGFADVQPFLAFVRRVAQAAVEAGLNELVWRGFSPPVDESVAWMTVTPDPAVIEVNEAPASTVSEFLDMSRMLFELVRAEGLSAYRLNYNGSITESGGGGQFTLGGPSPERSPFFLAPRLLPRLIVYLNHHPALSYWFAPVYVGSYSQSPRTDENVLESFNELQVALQLLESTVDPTPELIWKSLSPFLVDTSGNAHRSELNIEKLWNSYLPGRGRLGLVEFRSFRMAMDPETATSIAAMLRAVAAMLSLRTESPPLIEWGSRLHDRFALPFYLRQDLGAVFVDLENAGLGLVAPVTERLFANGWQHIGDIEHAGCRLDVEQAIEFWPLLGDAAAQSGGSRLVDASTTRLQLSLRPVRANEIDIHNWQLLVSGYRLPMRRERDEQGEVLVMGLRFRTFVPFIGLHPALAAQGPLVLTLLPPGGGRCLRITLHEWQPQGLPYDGLPDTFAEAEERKRERFVVEEIDAGEVPCPLAPPAESLTDYCFDLRRAREP